MWYLASFYNCNDKRETKVKSLLQLFCVLGHCDLAHRGAAGLKACVGIFKMHLLCPGFELEKLSTSSICT